MQSHILIVEDDESISNLIKITLEMAGYLTSQIFDGMEVLPALEQNKFDLILMDVMLPGMDGFTLMKKIKELDMPVIFLTAKNDLADRITMYLDNLLHCIVLKIFHLSTTKNIAIMLFLLS